MFHKINPELLVWGNGKLELLNLQNLDSGLQLASTDFPESDHIYWTKDNRLVGSIYFYILAYLSH